MAGNANSGRKEKYWRDALMLAVKREGKDKRPIIAAIADKCVDAALDGDMQAIKEIGDRLDGKSIQPNEHSGPEGGAIPIGIDVTYVDARTQKGEG
jgi:hypothetical protein